MKDQVVFANNRDGWALELHHYHDPETLDPSRKPVLMVPGYCMNTFILNYHPGGDSMVRYLVRQGFEVFANLNNLNNRPDRQFTYQDTADPDYSFNEKYLSFREMYGYTIDVGARYRF